MGLAGYVRRRTGCHDHDRPSERCAASRARLFQPAGEVVRQHRGYFRREQRADAESQCRRCGSIRYLWWPGYDAAACVSGSVTLCVLVIATGPSSSPPSWTHVAPVISPLRQSLEIQPASKGFVDLFQVESVAGADGAVHRGAWNAADLVDHHVRHRVETGAFAWRQRDTKQRSVHAIGRDRTDRYTRVRPIEQDRKS